jgi:membrane peptidoglycan carboxypeptidase
VRTASTNSASLPQHDTSALPAAAGPTRRYVTSLLGALADLALVGAGVLLGAALVYEIETSALEARLFSNYATKLWYTVGDGASPAIVFPRGGPFDQRRGYSLLPAFEKRLESHGFQIARQARMSPEMMRLESRGVVPPYREPPVAGLTIRGDQGVSLYGTAIGERIFNRFEDLPPLVVKTLLFLENRELLDPVDPRSNPVIEWDRLAKAGLIYVGAKLHLPFSRQGGSTLATQLEKYRHSSDGRTNSVMDKLGQMVGASLKAYSAGEDTRPWRRQIVVDYLNTVPLAAAPAYGELHGLGDGLYAWFGQSLPEVRKALESPALTPAKARAFKDVLALLLAVRAPTNYLVESRAALEAKVSEYTRLLVKAGVIDTEFAGAVEAIHLQFLPRAPVAPPPSFIGRKAPNAIRANVMQMLNLPGLYELDRLHLAVDSPIDVPLQNETVRLFQDLGSRDFVKAHNLTGEHLLEGGVDPSKVIYSLMLFERTPRGNVLRVDADNLNRPLNINDGIKMELGSTAKLRTLAHYLELVAQLYHELLPGDAKALARTAREAQDPITKWAAETLGREHDLDLDTFLQRALDRTYSANPGEAFFTGGGMHTFGNFDREDNGRIVTVREALRRSVNLAFIRLMRDVVRFHQARLPYNPQAVLQDINNPDRQRLLKAIAQEEGEHFLRIAYRKFRGLSPEEVVDRLLGHRSASPRRLAMLFFAWHPESGEDELAAWLKPRLPAVSADEVRRLTRAYGGARLNLSDYAYLLSRHPLDLWTAGEVVRQPNVSWAELVERSGEARRVASEWLFKTRNRHAQDVRLRIRMEADAFARMTPYWRRLAFPFKRLVPSLATAIGNSADRPAALAELMGIIVNDGKHRPTLRVTRLGFAEGTPYETVFEPAADVGEQVMEPAVAQALRGGLANVVSAGTARRVAGAFVGPDGKPVVVGGKTGSGDNRFKTFARHGGVISARPVNRTGTFVFYIGDRYYGVLTAFVPGTAAGAYRFTSALPVSILKLAAPAINARLGVKEARS